MDSSPMFREPSGCLSTYARQVDNASNRSLANKALQKQIHVNKAEMNTEIASCYLLWFIFIPYQKYAIVLYRGKILSLEGERKDISKLSYWNKIWI
jgi:hypothetical protein